MAVDGVNNSNNNIALYTAGAALVGGGTGVAAVYLTKPFLKDGAPTDAFTKKIQGNMVKHIDDLRQEIDNLKNIDELKVYIRNKKAFQKAGMTETLLSEADAIGFERAKIRLTDRINTIITDGGSVDDIGKGLFEASWDKNTKKFVRSTDEVSQAGFEAVKKAARSIQGKYAMIYGAIGAGVLGLGTLLCCGGKKQPEQPQNIDKQV